MIGNMLKQIHAVEEYILEKQYVPALRIIENVLILDLTEEDKAYATLLKVETSLLISNFDILESLEFVLEYYRRSTNNECFAKAKYLHGWWLVTQGDYFEAREVFLESYAHYKRCEKTEEQARVLNRLALVTFQIGEVDSAARILSNCINLYARLGEKQNELSILLNLGSLYYASGSMKKAIKIFDKFEKMASDKEYKFGYFYQNLAMPYALMYRIDTAKNVIAMSTSYHSGYPHRQAIYYENLGWIHLLEEDYQSAEKALLKGLKISLKIAPKSALISQIKRRLADAYIGLKRANEAKQYCDEAMEVAKHINERVEIAACWRVYAQLDVINGNEPKARDWFTKAIDMFAMISSRYELAATRYLAATSGIYQNGERQALLYMAREYFESEDVAHYIEKIDKELKRTQISPKPRRTKNLKKIPTIIAGNVRMKKLVDLAEHVAPSDMNVLLTGETGTGKDLLARFIHYHSNREGRFISVNAAAIPDQMIESELFGYKKGAYTGADRATSGLIEEAEGGTFYLNEVADASSELQAKLLDVIETRKVRRLGERESNKIDFRIIAATNHDIEQLIRDGKFRADLYHRLREIPITLPPLSDRIDDMEPLLRHFLSSTKLNGDSSDNDMTRLAEVLSSRIWPGNVRQLEAEVKRLALTSDGDIKQIIITAMTSAPSEAEQLQALLEETGWNKAKAARILGVSEGTIRNRIKKLGITLPVS